MSFIKSVIKELDNEYAGVVEDGAVAAVDDDLFSYMGWLGCRRGVIELITIKTTPQGELHSGALSHAISPICNNRHGGACT